MTEIFLTDADGLHARLEKIITERTGGREILKTPNGKPYVENGPKFSISHSMTRGIIALSDVEIGVDLEVVRGSGRDAVVARFSRREQDEIVTEKDFLRHWTVREAYVKMLGATLLEYLGRLEYFEGTLFFDGEPVKSRIITYDFGFGVAAVCTEK